jgi:hypothetical protein
VIFLRANIDRANPHPDPGLMNIAGSFSFQFRFAGGLNTHHRNVREEREVIQ